MIATEDQLRSQLHRLALALVPDDVPQPSEGIRVGALPPRTPSGEPNVHAITQTAPLGRRSNRILGLAAALLLLGAGGAGLLLGTNRNRPTPAASAIHSASTPTVPVQPPWTDGVEMIVYVRPGATQTQIRAIHDMLANASNIVDVGRLVYLDPQQALAEAAVIFADDPRTLALLTPSNIPTEFKVVLIPGHVSGDLYPLSAALRAQLSGVNKVQFKDDPPVTREKTLAPGAPPSPTTSSAPTPPDGAPVPADDPTLPPMGSVVNGDRPPWLGPDGSVNRDMMGVFTSVAKDGLVIGYVLTDDIWAPPLASDGFGPPVTIVDGQGHPIGHIIDGVPQIGR